MAKKKFIDKKNARHFHVMHRSLADPLADDANAPQLVLHEMTPSGQPGQEASDCESFDGFDEPMTVEPGEAAKYGIFFDDQNEYNYLQHMREIGRSSNAVWIEAKPADADGKKRQAKRDSKKSNGFTLLVESDHDDADASIDDSPDEHFVRLPAKHELDVYQDGNNALMNRLSGGVDADPAVLEALAALDDDAYIQDGAEDFFEELIEEDTLSDADFLPSVSDVSSLSGHHQNTNSSALDRKFEELMEKEYDDEEWGGLDSDAEDVMGDESIQRYEGVLDDFIENHDVVGKRMVQKHGDGTPLSQVDDLRASLSELTRDVEKYRYESEQVPDEVLDAELDALTCSHAHDRWDCETILSTYSNLENRPHVIKERSLRKIVLSHKTGMPLGVLKPKKMEPIVELDGEDESGVNLGQARPKQEDKDEKRLRKQQIKAAKRDRRTEKKDTKLIFKQEVQRQKAMVK